MGPCHIAITRHPLVNPRKELLSAGDMAPVPHQIAQNGEQTDDVHTRLEHLRVGDVSDGRSCRSGGFEGGPDGVAFCAEGTGEKGRADVRDDAGEDYLRAVGCPDCRAEFGVVPRIDLAVAPDHGG